MTQSITRFEALKLCLERAGTQEKMADDLGVTQPTISRMLTSSKQLRHDLVLEAQRIYGVSCHDLRPDIYPRDMMVDRHVSNRFAGVDQDVANRMTA